MAKNVRTTVQKGSATVTRRGENIIVCRLEGDITGPIVEGSMRQTKLLADEIRNHNQPRLLLDIGGIKKQTSEARSRAKDLSTFGLERIAVSGGSAPVILMGRYIARAGGMGGYTRFFRREKDALQWLEKGDVKKADTQLARRSIIALLLTLISIATLVGWIMDVPMLRSFAPNLKAMNPLGAITLLLFALSLVAMGRRWRQRPVSRGIVWFTGIWAIVMGLSVLLRFCFSIDFGLDSKLFIDRLAPGGFDALAPSTGLSLVFGGTALLMLLAKRPSNWWGTVHGLVVLGISLLSTAVLIGYSFGFSEVYNLNTFLPMPLNTALALLILSNALISVGNQTKLTKRGLRWFYSYWQAIALTFLLVLATGIIWNQTKRDIDQSVDTDAREAFVKVDNALQSRLAAYGNALSGYRGLFAASSDVEPQEFKKYFVSSQLAENYPGFLAVSYAAAVPDASKQGFETQTRARANAEFPAYKNFTIFPRNNNELHYPLLYTQPGTATTTYGFDLSSEQVRLEALERARNSGKTIASGIINLNASQGSGAVRNDGFFLSTPVYDGVEPGTEAGRRTAIRGFVITYFQTKALFESIFKSFTDRDIKFTLRDMQEGTLVYSSPAANVPPGAPVKENTVLTVGERQWQFNMYVAPTYARSELYQTLPGAVLAFGLTVSVLAGALVSAQLRRRDQALQIASRMTEDLSNERDKAVATQQKDEAILSSIGDAVFAINTQGRITLFNPACERISGYGAHEAIGRHYADILKFRFEKNNKLNDSFIKSALSGRVSSMKNHTVLLRKDGRSVAVADSAAPIRNASGQLLGAIVVFRDVSKEQELDRAKTEFVSLASHQLRTPLSAINWYGEMLLAGDAGKLGKDQREYVEEIYAGNQRMIELVNSLLDVSRLEVGKLSNQPVPTDMKQVAESLEKELVTSIQSKELFFVKQIQANLPAVLADPKLLRMIVQNLLSNAVKYTPAHGSVHLTMRRATERELASVRLPLHHDYFFMSVSDTGYGIPKAQQPKIFSKMFRADNVQALDVEGTGLGLYIVKEVVEQLGGKVWFTSIESAGSTFYVILPFKTQASAGKPLAG